MSIQQQIEQKLQALAPQWLQVDNESHRHHVPAHSETHFRVVMVSSAFDGQRLIDRQRTIHAALADELAGDVHALGMRLFTPEEWQKKSQKESQTRQHAIQPTPDCRGGHHR